MYDYLIIVSGLFGSGFAHEMTKAGKSCLVLEMWGVVTPKQAAAKIAQQRQEAGIIMGL